MATTIVISLDAETSKLVEKWQEDRENISEIFRNAIKEKYLKGSKKRFYPKVDND